MHVEHDTEGRSCNDWCIGKAISNIYSECVFVACDIEHAMRTLHIVICSLPRSKIVFHVLP